MASVTKRFDAVVYHKGSEKDSAGTVGKVKDFPRTVGKVVFWDNGNGLLELDMFPGLKINLFPSRPKEDAPPKTEAAPW